MTIALIKILQWLTHVVDYRRHPQRDTDQKQAHGEQKTSCSDYRPSRTRRKFPGIDELLVRADGVDLAPFTFALSSRPVISSLRLVQLLRTAQDLLLLQLVGYVQRHVVVVVVMNFSANIRTGVACVTPLYELRWADLPRNNALEIYKRK